MFFFILVLLLQQKRFLKFALLSQAKCILYFNRCCQVILKDTHNIYEYLHSCQRCDMSISPISTALDSVHYLFIFSTLRRKMASHWFNLHFLTTVEVGSTFLGRVLFAFAFWSNSSHIFLWVIYFLYQFCLLFEL